MTARPMTEDRADELLDAFEQAVSDRAEDGMSYRHHVDGPRDEAREALRAVLLSTSAAERRMREALEEAAHSLAEAANALRKVGSFANAGFADDGAAAALAALKDTTK